MACSGNMFIVPVPARSTVRSSESRTVDGKPWSLNYVRCVSVRMHACVFLIRAHARSNARRYCIVACVNLQIYCSRIHSASSPDRQLYCSFEYVFPLPNLEFHYSCVLQFHHQNQAALLLVCGCSFIDWWIATHSPKRIYHQVITYNPHNNELILTGIRQAFLPFDSPPH